MNPNTKNNNEPVPKYQKLTANSKSKYDPDPRSRSDSHPDPKFENHSNQSHSMQLDVVEKTEIQSHVQTLIWATTKGTKDFWQRETLQRPGPALIALNLAQIGEGYKKEKGNANYQQ